MKGRQFFFSPKRVKHFILDEISDHDWTKITWYGSRGTLFALKIHLDSFPVEPIICVSWIHLWNYFVKGPSGFFFEFLTWWVSYMMNNSCTVGPWKTSYYVNFCQTSNSVAFQRFSLGWVFASNLSRIPKERNNS